MLKEYCYELALNTEMAEKYYFTEHTEDYLNVFVWVAPGSDTLTYNQSCTFYKLYINFYLYAPLFTEFELRKVFEKFNGDRASNNENINKVHNLPGHASYVRYSVCKVCVKVWPYFRVLLANNNYMYSLLGIFPLTIVGEECHPIR